MTDFSRRAQWNAPANRLAIARASCANLLDLTESNPTRAGITYPLDDLSEAFARASRASYDPHPLGIPSAREAVAQHVGCDAADIVITASTSEAYGYLFKLLTDPGDAVLTATPSYPLLEHLAALELIELRSFPLELHRRWELDPGRIAPMITARTRAIIVVNPNNPTGSYVAPGEQDSLAAFERPIISDEVFFDYPLDNIARQSLFRDDVLTFTLGGLSKSAGLPHLKLGWIRVSGPGASDAINALELIADNYLSVATPVQQALPDLLRLAPAIRDAIRVRTRLNLDVLTRAIELAPSARVLPVEGGWSAIIRIPHIEPEEELALRLIERESVAVHPGYFFDFESEGYLVVSLLTQPDVFIEGVQRVVRQIPG